VDIFSINKKNGDRFFIYPHFFIFLTLIVLPQLTLFSPRNKKI